MRTRAAAGRDGGPPHAVAANRDILVSVWRRRAAADVKSQLVASPAAARNSLSRSSTPSVDLPHPRVLPFLYFFPPRYAVFIETRRVRRRGTLGRKRDPDIRRRSPSAGELSARIPTILSTS